MLDPRTATDALCGQTELLNTWCHFYCHSSDEPRMHQVQPAVERIHTFVMAGLGPATHDLSSGRR